MKKQLIAAVLLLTLMGCGGKTNNPAPVIPPGKVTLSAPEQNAICITGTVVSSTESNVSFNWNASANTSSYDLVIKNLLTATTVTKNTDQTQLTVTLLRNTPYSWWIVSKSTQSTTTSQSDTWKFYNAGPGVVTYAPFPAEIIAPVSGHTIGTTTGSISLTWKGSSVDGSAAISTYDVYFGTSSTPPLLKAGVTGSSLDVPVKTGNTYYWKVITKDVHGNTSDSGVANFTVQ